MAIFLITPSPFSEGEFHSRGALSIKEFLKWSGIGYSKFFDEVRAKRLFPKKIGARTVVFWPECERWARELPDAGPRRGRSIKEQE